MTDIDARALDRELKRGSAELLILSLLDARPRHGYELGKLIHTRSGGRAARACATTEDVGRLCGGGAARHGRRTCLTGRPYVRASLGFRPTREAEIVDELSQHLEDC